MDKQSYNEVLRQMITERFGEGVIDPAELDDIYAFVKEECLRSFKNGLAAGRKRASRPNPKAAVVKGRALENGKLRSVPTREE